MNTLHNFDGFKALSEGKMGLGFFVCCFPLLFLFIFCVGLVPLDTCDTASSCWEQEMVISFRVSMEGKSWWQHPKPLFLSLLI